MGGQLLICLFGYLLWNIDLEFCTELESIRAFWARFLALHGWWHILTAIDAGRFMSVVREIHDHERQGKAQVHGRWKNG